VSQYRHQANAICSDFDRFQLPTSGTLADRLAAGVDKGRASLAAYAGFGRRGPSPGCTPKFCAPRISDSSWPAR
jgi:hypothetical protein